MNYCHAMFRPGLLLTILLAGLFFISVPYANNDELLTQIRILDEKYQKLVAEYYNLLPGDLEPVGDIDQLVAKVIATSESKHPIPAIQLLVGNLDNLTAQPGHPGIIKLTDFLLEQNERQLVERIYTFVEASGDSKNIAYTKYNFAKYHARLNQWDKVISLIKNTFSQLSSDDSDYAYLLQGGALQYLKQHRSSIESYANIPAGSRFYVHAQLNTAIANIRQGWITDARLIIKKIIPVSKSGEIELTNRIYLVLGYALLNKEYYRDARDAFRKVKLDSQYTSKALLGIALTAISQGDYVGGLNALSILKTKQSHDLSADEAYMLIPYVYEKLEQVESIADSFLESIDHYQKRLLELNDLKGNKLRFKKVKLEKHSGDVFLGNARFPFSRHYPIYLLKNHDNLRYLNSARTTAELSSRIKRLLAEYDDLLIRIGFDMIERQKKFITSYLNQSRYGLAKHYDDSQQGAQ